MGFVRSLIQLARLPKSRAAIAQRVTPEYFPRALETAYGIALDDAGSSAHRMGGKPSWKNADCPNCQKHLQRFLSLDASAPELESLGWSAPRLELLLCWECPLGQDTFTYRVNAANELEILHAQRGEPETDFPYEKYPRWFTEARVNLEPLDSELDTDLRAHFYLRKEFEDGLGVDERFDIHRHMKISTPRHQVGGVPFLFDWSETLCPGCGNRMEFLATVADRTVLGEAIVDNDYVQSVAYLCRPCQVVSMRQECD